MEIHALQLLGLLLSLTRVIQQFRAMAKEKAQEQEVRALQLRLQELEEKIRELTRTQRSD